MNTPSFPLSVITAAVVVLASGGNAHAQYEINHTIAQAGIPNAGGLDLLNDAPGYPVSLNRSGSYKLTSNLNVPAGSVGVVINATGVTLDLNGYKIVGPGVCTRNDTTYFVGCAPATLDASGTIGVQFMKGGNVLRNGAIQGFATGVLYKGSDHLEDLIVSHNMRGISSPQHHGGARTVIRSVRAELNAYSGFSANDAMIQGSTAASNGGHGFFLGRSMVLDSFAFQNLLHGFDGAAANGAPGLVLGRNVSAQNKGGDFDGATSMGGNVSTNGQVY